VDVKQPLSTLLAALQKFWGNLLSQAEESRSKGQDSLDTLTNYLSNKLKLPQNQSLESLEEPTNIFSFNDEIDFWNQMLESANGNVDYKRIVELMKPLDAKLKESNNNS